MLDLKRVVGETNAVLASLKKRGNPAVLDEVKAVVELDGKRKELLHEVEKLKAERNEASAEIARKKKAKEDATELLNRMKEVSQRVKELDSQVGETERQMREILLVIPNTLHESVPEGKDAAGNQLVREWGKPVKFSFPARTHDEIGEAAGLFDFKKAGEVSGARFVFLKGGGARLERALIRFMLHHHQQRGYEELLPPLLVNRNALTGTGQLPKFEGDVFHIEKYDYFLIPTAEVPVTNYHRDEILDEKQLPLCYMAYTPCFRSEAGSYGKDTKGLKRQHQFNKVELVKFTTPETSGAELEGLLHNAEEILQALKLPYRVMLLCGGDTGASSYKTYDIEVWSPATESWMEISSCSVFSDYQARRANIRYRGMDRKVRHVHTINGSGLAVGRTLIAILENYQKENGTFEIPEILQSYIDR